MDSAAESVTTVEDSATPKGLLPFAYAKANQVLLDSRDESPLLIHTGALSTQVLLEVRRYLGGQFAVESVTPDFFQRRLTEAYQRTNNEAAQMAEDISADVDLSRLVDQLPDLGDLMDAEDDAPIIRLINAILSQGERLQRRVMPHINHPNFIWAIRADELAMVDGERFFEVFNGHPLVYNDGDSMRHGMEKTWDVVNTIRLRDGRPLMFGIGTDDSHNYQELAPGRANTGRGWVMVQAEALNPDAILAAMDEGHFYASSGVTLSEVHYDGSEYRVMVEPEEGVSYTIEFYGTDADHDPAPVAVNDPETGELITYRYSDDVGRLLQRTRGIEASFAVAPDLLYVRARVVSDKVMDNPVVEDEQEKAWTQPVTPGIPR